MARDRMSPADKTNKAKVLENKMMHDAPVSRKENQVFGGAYLKGNSLKSSPKSGRKAIKSDVASRAIAAKSASRASSSTVGKAVKPSKGSTGWKKSK